MAKLRDYTWLLTRLKFAVYNNEGQADQAYAGPSTDTNLHFREAINAGYEAVIEEAKAECGFDRFVCTQDVVWPADQVVFEFPDVLGDKQGLAIRDVTDAADGVGFTVFEGPEYGQVFWKDKDRIQWGTTGPSSARTLRYTYLADAEYLGEHPRQEPKLIPYKFRWLIVWAAALELEEVGSRQPPSSWTKRFNDIQSNFHKFLSRSRFSKGNPKTIRMTDFSF